MSGKHPVELRMQVCAAYLASGDSEKVARLTGVPARTIRDWTGQDWWQDATEQLRERHERQLDARLSAIIDTATAAVQDRLEHGDEVTGKDGTLLRRKVSARDAAIISAVAFDKRALLRGQATRRIEHVDLPALRAQFSKAIEVEDANTEG
jgi:hypothetical protein